MKTKKFSPTHTLFHLLFTIAIGLTIHSANANPADCGPIMSDPQIMKDMLSNIGHNNEIHRLCKISEMLITKETNKTLKTYRFCLNAHGFKEEEIQAEIKSGEPGGREVYERTNDKDLLCKKDRESF